MKTAVKIEANISKQGIKALADGIVNVIKTAHENHMDQETVRHALDILGKGASVDGATIANNVFTSNEDIKFKETDK